MFGGNMGNMQGMMKKVQKMQADMAKMQEDLKTKTFEVAAGGGMITIVAKGTKELASITIKPEAVDKEDIDMLQDLIVVAVNEAFRKIDALSEQEMSKITKGMKLPPGFM